MSTLLFIGNTDLTWSIIENSLIDSNFHVVKAHNLKEALPLFLSEKPDLLLVDVQAQPINGFQIARFFKSHGELMDIPICLGFEIGHPQGIACIYYIVDQLNFFEPLSHISA